jgi:hypothetical protein
VRRVGLGQVLPASTFTGSPPWAVLAGSDARLLAVYEPFDGHRIGGRLVEGSFARPVVVVAANA